MSSSFFFWRRLGRLAPSLGFLLTVLLAGLATRPVLAQEPVISGVETPAVGRGQAQPIEPGQTPAGLTAAEWAGIQGQLAAAQYRAEPADDGGYGAANPTQGWRIGYGADGWTRLRPGERATAPWAWGLRLTGYGYQALTRLAKPAGLEAAGPRLTYRWDANLSEWWINTAGGLEQGFTVRQRPGEANGQPLVVELAISGGLSPVRQGEGIAFVDAAGATVLSYDRLYVLDAAGRRLPARLELQATGRRLRLVVDDAAAVYPLTIDPWVWAQEAYLKASNTGANDRFGQAVAVSGDTVVVGAAYEDSNATGVNGVSNNLAANSGAAYVFRRDSGGAWSQEAYLKASNTGANDNFGAAVAISGDTVVIGAIGEESGATGVNGNQSDNSFNDAGAAYVFRRDSGGVWSQEAYLKASNTYSGDLFGTAVAISGDTVVVGALNEESNATGVNGNQSNHLALYSGAAYVFVRDSGGVWAQEAYLKASNTGASDNFGNAVAISGDTVVVGANNEDSSATGVNGDGSDNSADNAGAAYVFGRDSGGVWSQEAYLKASNTGATDYFGRSVAVSGDTVVVGAYFEDSSATGVNGDGSDNSANDAGAAYVFRRDSGGVWSQEAYLKASNTEAGDWFGPAVTISGDTVVIGAEGEDSSATGANGDESSNAADNAGAAYVFVRDSGGAWSQQAYLKASNPGATDIFGAAVAISGDTVVVGAYQEDSNATGVNGDGSNNSVLTSGAAYVFGRSAQPPTLIAHRPLTNAVAAPLDSSVVLTYSADIDAASVTSRTVAIHSMMRGLITGTHSVNGSVVTVDPSRNFFPGELVYASATTRTTDLAGMQPLTPTQWQFNAAAGVGPGEFPLTHTVTTAARGARSVGAADVDGDGDIDLLSASLSDDKIAWYENDGSGSFTTVHTVTTAADGAYSVGAADVDGDGDIDLLSASWWDNKIAWYENDGAINPTFTAHTVTTAANAARSVAAADVDGDGDLDLFSASANDGKIAWYENDGAIDPTFTAHTVTTAAAGAQSVGAADVDGDGDIDLLSASSSGSNYKIAWYENDGAADPTFTDHTVTTAVAGAQSVAAADVDGDGDIDLLSASSWGGGEHKIAWYENDGASDPSFTAHTVTLAAYGAQSVGAADVDGDGDLDLLAASLNIDQIAWYENDGAADFTITHTVTLAADGANSVGAADVDGDGDLDLLSTSSNDDKIAWYENVVLPDVTLSKTVSPTSAQPGDSITYTLTFSNAGTAAATGVIITDSVPVSVTNVSVSRSGAVITDTGATPAYVWQVADLAPNAGGVITLTGTLTEPLAAGVFVVNTAEIACAETGSDDANNTSAAGLTITNAAPVADAGDDQTVTQGKEVQLDGSDSRDPNGDLFTYGWRQTGGSLAVTLSSSGAISPTFTAPTEETVLTFTLTVTDTASGTLVGTDTVVVTVSKPSDIYLPLITKNYSSGPDLVITDLTADGSGITVKLENQGSAAVTDAFWVDVYFNPAGPPGLNQPWDTVAEAGAVWGVTQPLAPGQSLTLTVGDAFYFPDRSSSSFPAGATTYALVDSVNYDTDYGNVAESNESNNLAGPVSATGVLSPVNVNPAAAPSLEGLPGR